MKEVASVAADYGAVVVAGGFGTRTKDATNGLPKALIEVDGRALIDYLLEDLEGVGFGRVVLVSNALHFKNIEKHLDSSSHGVEVKLLNDGAESSEERLGALGDLLFAVDEGEDEKEKKAWLVSASDYAYWKSFGIGDILEFAERHPESFIVVGREVEDRSEIVGRFGCLELDEDDETHVVGFEEKPEEPKSNCAVVAFYVYRRNDIETLREYKDTGGDLDSPSNIIPDLIERGEVRMLKVPNNLVDAGTPAEIERARNY